jgi:hypothetical protein
MAGTGLASVCSRRRSDALGTGGTEVNQIAEANPPGGGCLGRQVLNLPVCAAQTIEAASGPVQQSSTVFFRMKGLSVGIGRAHMYPELARGSFGHGQSLIGKYCTDRQASLLSIEDLGGLLGGLARPLLAPHGVALARPLDDEQGSDGEALEQGVHEVGDSVLVPLKATLSDGETPVTVLSCVVEQLLYGEQTRGTRWGHERTQ